MDFLPHLSRDQRDHLLQGLAFLSRIFWGPDQETCIEIISGSSLSWSSQLAPLLDHSFTENIEELNTIIEKYSDDSFLFRYLEEAYIRLFVNARDGIPAPLYQSCYESENALLMGPPAVMMKERIESLGLSMAGQVNEPPDHLSVQIEYLYFLLEKGFREEDRDMIASASSFASETMLPWVAELHHKLDSETERSFYTSTASALLCMLEFIGRLNIQNKKRS
jgi:TorA-specific chaperone